MGSWRGVAPGCPLLALHAGRSRGCAFRRVVPRVSRGLRTGVPGPGVRMAGCICARRCSRGVNRRIAMRVASALRAFGLSLLLAGCATSANLSSGAPPAPAPADDYQIGVDDMVQVSVWRNPELGITAPVRPDGKISVPLVGDVVAGGRTPDEVAK